MAAERRTVTIVGVQYMSSNKDGNPRFGGVRSWLWCARWGVGRAVLGGA